MMEFLEEIKSVQSDGDQKQYPSVPDGRWELNPTFCPETKTQD